LEVFRKQLLSKHAGMLAIFEDEADVTVFAKVLAVARSAYTPRYSKLVLPNPFSCWREPGS
jgi:hypothetical protein